MEDSVKQVLAQRRSVFWIQIKFSFSPDEASQLHSHYSTAPPPLPADVWMRLPHAQHATTPLPLKVSPRIHTLNLQTRQHPPTAQRNSQCRLLASQAHLANLSVVCMLCRPGSFCCVLHMCHQHIRMTTLHACIAKIRGTWKHTPKITNVTAKDGMIIPAMKKKRATSPAAWNEDIIKILMPQYSSIAMRHGPARIE